MFKEKIPKVPLILQMEAMDCGAASLCMIMAYYRKWVPLSDVREKCNVSRDGANLSNVLLASSYYGLDGKGLLFSAEGLKNNGHFPCIAYWDHNHFVVINGFKNDKVYINDPNAGSVVISFTEFKEHFSNIILELKPGENFKTSGSKMGLKEFFLANFKSMKLYLFILFLIVLLTAVLESFTPIFTKAFIDFVLPSQSNRILITLISLMVFTFVLQTVVNLIRYIFWPKVQAVVAAKSSTTFMWELMNMPITFFNQRNVGEIMRRLEGSVALSEKLISDIPTLILNVIMTVVYFVIMINNNVLLTFVGVLGSAINLFVGSCITQQRKNLVKVLQKELSLTTTVTISGISAITTLKSSASEETFFKKWIGYLIKKRNVMLHNYSLRNKLLVVSELITNLTTTFIAVTGIYLCIKGKMTQGAIVAFQGMIGLFITPVKNIITSGDDFSEMQTHLDRLYDVYSYPGRRNYENKTTDCNEKDFDICEGLIEFKNVSFGYDFLRSPVIEDFSYKITPGKSVALVGPSGCGKSTIINLLCGLLDPWSGEVLFDGKNRLEYNNYVLSDSIAVVSQETRMYDGSIENNIRMWNETITNEKIVSFAKQVGIHNVINERTGGYKALIQSNNIPFSGGQIQCLEIVRALSQEPKILVLDEATSAMDANTEYEIMELIKSLGITTIIVSHRLSTIRDCDEIIVMDKGKIVGIGNHLNLYENNKLYANMIDNA